MTHTHDMAAFLNLVNAVHTAEGLTVAERRHVVKAAAEAFLSRVRPPAFETVVQRYLEQASAHGKQTTDPGHTPGEIQPPKKGRVAR